MLDIQNASRIFEAGCGPGLLIPTILLNKTLNCEFISTDLSEKMIESSRQRVYIQYLKSLYSIFQHFPMDNKRMIQKNCLSKFLGRLKQLMQKIYPNILLIILIYIMVDLFFIQYQIQYWQLKKHIEFQSLEVRLDFQFGEDEKQLTIIQFLEQLQQKLDMCFQRVMMPFIQDLIKQNLNYFQNLWDFRIYYYGIRTQQPIDSQLNKLQKVRILA